MVEMQLYAIGGDPRLSACALVLRETSGNRCLVMAIGVAEAVAIAQHFRQEPPPRPLSHDLLRSIIEALGGRVTKVVVTDLVDGTYHARILLDSEGRHVELDARPSDAVALAVRTEARIFAEEAVLERAGVEAAGEKRSQETGGKPSLEASREDDAKLQVFRDFVNQLDLEDQDPPRR